MRTFAEWLVVPLVALPLLVAGGLLVWAQDAHRRELAPYRQAGEDQVRTWWESPPGSRNPAAGGIRAFVMRQLDIETRGLSIEHPVGRVRVVVDEPLLGRDPWQFTREFPGGLRAEALADPAIRLQVEAGRSPTELDAVDDGARAFSGLLASPELDTLRDAPLPCPTKLFLVYRWLDEDPAHEVARASARFLEVVRTWERALDVLPSPLPWGASRVGTLEVLNWGVNSTVVYPDEASWPAPSNVELVGPEAAPVRLFWAFPPSALPSEDVVWSGRLESPCAGVFVFQAKHGLAWWQAPRVKRWAGPFVALLLASLLIPVALLLTLRRRRRLDEARVRFLNELAHDLRTPLTSLRLHADLLTSGKAKAEKKDAYASRMALEAARLSSLLGNLLDLSRLERGRRVFEREPIDVSDTVEAARREFVAVFPSRAEDIRPDGEAGVVVRADRSAFARVLANLLENAGKFTTPGTPIHVRWSPTADGVQVVVEDEGHGIPPGERREVFERYGRGAKAKKDGVPGTGLGLALVKELVEGMGGTIALRAGRGAVFEIRLGATDA